jgi:hypothetical protein
VSAGGPPVPVGGGVPVDPETGERFGYLSKKASTRKIILRRQLGLPWVLAAIAFAVAILVGGGASLLLRPDHPGRPYVDEGALARYPVGDISTRLPDGTGFVDRSSGLLVLGRGATSCPRGGWTGPMLRARAARGHLYVDPTHPVALPPCPRG